MKTSDAVKTLLNMKGYKQIALAKALGLSSVGMSRKMRCNSWYVRDLTSAVKELTGAKLILRLDDGTELELTDEGTASYTQGEKQYKSRKQEAELTAQYGEDYLDKLLDDEDYLI